MTRAVVYARLSKEDRERAGSGIESTATQLAHARQTAEAEGWRVVDELIDEGVSGAEMVRRPGLQRLLGAVDRREVDVVLVRDLDRLARDALRQSALLSRLTDAGVRVWCYADGAYAATEGLGYGMTAMRGVVAEMERAALARRTRGGIRRIVELGGIPGAPPLGYQLTRDGALPRWVIDEAEAEVVREVARQYVAAGGVWNRAAAALTAAGVARRGRAASRTVWEPRHVYKVLSRAVYCGVLRWGERVVVYEGGTARVIRAPAESVSVVEHPELRILPPELAAEVDRLLATPRPNSRIRWGGATRPRYLASGYVRCGLCGAPITVRGSRGGRLTHYLCGVELRSGCAGCRGVGCRDVETVDRALLRAIGPLIDGPLAERALDIVRQRLEAQASGAAAEADRERLTRELRAVEQRIARLVDAIADGEAPAPLVERLRGEERRAVELREAVTELARAVPARLDVERTVRAAQARLDELRAGACAGGVAARPVLGALLGDERLRAIPVRQGGRDLWHLSGQVGAWWLLAACSDGPLAQAL